MMRSEKMNDEQGRKCIRAVVEGEEEELLYSILFCDSLSCPTRRGILDLTD